MESNTGDYVYGECPRCHKYVTNIAHICSPVDYSYTYPFLKSERVLLLEILEVLKRIENKLDSWKE